MLEAGAKVRRRAWQEREIPLEYEGGPALPDRRAAPDARRSRAAELLGAVRDAIADALTPHQRTRPAWRSTLNDVPIDVLAERLATTRGALYKTLHDARKTSRPACRAGLEERTAIEPTTTSSPSCSGPDGPELACDECFEHLDRYVELEHAGARRRRRDPGHARPPRGCPACAEDHESLSALLAADA